VSASPDPPPPPAHLILVGLPGAGKSTHGRRAARRLQRPFIDLDRRIVHLDGRPIHRIFAESGEAAFRATETRATAALANDRASIVAPGGGWIMDPANTALVQPASTIVWLQVSPAMAVKRMGARIRLRPLLAQGDPVLNLERLLARRRDRYAVADHVIDTELLDWQGVVTAIAALAPPLAAD
jgi:shikimate kinase